MITDHGFGATFDVQVDLPSTRQEEFKRAMFDSVRLAYPQASLEGEAEILVGRGYLREDRGFKLLVSARHRPR